MKFLFAIGTLVALLTLAGCASPGAPQPPSLRLPRRVQDLAATRKGDQVLLTWTPPTQTTDGENIKHAGRTFVCRDLGITPMLACATVVSTLSNSQVEHWTKGSMVARLDYTDNIPAAYMQQDPLGFLTYALEDDNPNGKSAGLSNQVKVPLAPTLPAPNNVLAKVTPEGVLLEWSGAQVATPNPALKFLYRVLRQSAPEEKKPEVIVGEVPASGTSMSYLDRNIEWEKAYQYDIEPITQEQVASSQPIEIEGEASPPVKVTVHDVFPPATPTGLQAVFSGVGQKPFIDLTWAPNLEPDLAGYNVFRQEQGTSPVKINSELVKTPSYRDSNVESGHQYIYTVTAVDLRGNESGPSQPATESVPNP